MINKLWQELKRASIRTFAFVNKEMRTIWHQPRLIFSLILGPFLILLIFGVGYRNQPRTLNTLFVVPEGSTIEGFVEDYADSFGSRINVVGVIHDPDEADRRLRRQEVDLVVVTPFNPMQDWENDEHSKFSLYHYEIDPIEKTYIQVLGQRYAEQINNQILLTSLSQKQEEANDWHNDIQEAKTMASNVRQALAAGDRAAAADSADELQRDLDILTLALGSGVALMSNLEGAGGESGVSQELQAELESLQNRSDDMSSVAAESGTLQEGEEAAAEVESSLERVDTLLTDFRESDTAVLVSPFESETLSVTQVSVDSMHFYVPAVISLLLQHLAITLAGLSVIREKLGGAMELFRASPVSAFEMLLGKYLSYALLISVLAAILTGLIVLGLQVPQLGQWGHYILVVLALLLASLGIGFHISISSQSDSQAIQFGMLTLLSAIFFSGFFIPLYRLILPVRVLSWLLPATYGTVMLQDVMLRGQPPQWLLLFGLFAFAALLYGLAWFRLHRQMAQE